MLGPIPWRAGVGRSRRTPIAPGRRPRRRCASCRRRSTGAGTSSGRRRRLASTPIPTDPRRFTTRDMVQTEFHLLSLAAFRHAGAGLAQPDTVTDALGRRPSGRYRVARTARFSSPGRASRSPDSSGHGPADRQPPTSRRVDPGTNRSWHDARRSARRLTPVRAMLCTPPRLRNGCTALKNVDGARRTRIADVLGAIPDLPGAETAWSSGLRYAQLFPQHVPQQNWYLSFSSTTGPVGPCVESGRGLPEPASSFPSLARTGWDWPWFPS